MKKLRWRAWRESGAARLKPRDDGFCHRLCLASSVCESCTPCSCSCALATLSASSLLHKSFCVSAVQFRPERTVRLHHRATATGVGVKAVGSWLMLCSLISVVVFSVCAVDWTTEEDVLCIHEWLNMSSKDGRSAGRTDRHHLISCWHSGGGGGGISTAQHTD